jgi:hypothetical protein
VQSGSSIGAGRELRRKPPGEGRLRLRRGLCKLSNAALNNRGTSMLGRLRRLGSRQFTAAILIFALMLQGMALAVASSRLAAGTANTADRTGFEICRRSGPSNAKGDAGPLGAPEHRSDAHCIFCLAGAAHALGASPPGVQFHIVAFTIVPWTFTVWRLPTFAADANARPRAPPLA